MGIKIVAENEEEKSQLATEICELSARAITCSNLHLPRTNKPPFINWYLVLRVDENADICSLKKQYHKLALILHPDKNKHSKAETAFKLVSEAYYCLSDRARRAIFDSEKKTVSCIKCNTNPHINTTNNVEIRKPYEELSKLGRIRRRLKELRTQLKDEATIIEKCLIVNATASLNEPVNASGIRKETPVFNPSDYQYKGYPHCRTINYKKLGDLRAGLKIGSKRVLSADNNESPIFEYRSGRSSFMSRCSSTRDR